MGETTAILKYALDGTTSVNEIAFGGNTAKISTVVTWEGDSPVFTSTFTVQDTDVHSADKWTLTDGGKKMTVTRAVNVGGQQMASKLVLVKQP
jgi:hypothetical protein